jgi:hypothetical protein
MPTLKEAIEAGAISTRNSKMPGSSFAISAKHCNVGGKLAQIKGSTCSRCYALKLQNMRPSVNQGWTANLDKAVKMISHNPDQWARYMAFQITKASEKTGQPYHRWFDSGDLQSLDMLRAIALVCDLTPHVRHWLPTREAKLVKAYLDAFGAFPTNLVVRVSATMIGDKPLNYPNTSTVHKKTDAPSGHVCPASQQGNACGDCRACWSLDVPNVSYPLH